MEFLNRLYLMIYCNVQELLHDEEGAVDIVAIVVLIGIAVLLAVLFRQQITDLLGALFQTINGTATNAVS